MNSSRIPLITVIVFCSIAIAAYLFLPTVSKDKKVSTPKMEATAKSATNFDFEAYLQKVKAGFKSADTLSILEKWEGSKSFNDLSVFYHQKGESVVEAYYIWQSGVEGKDAKKLERAGDLFTATSSISNSEEMKTYLIKKTVQSYKNALLLDTSNINLQMKLAGMYIEQGTNPMQGISMLLGIVKNNPQNADAQLMLGKFAIMSGQFEKAIQRLEKVIYLRPQSNDAMFLLAIAYENKGDKKKALELLEQCKKKEKNPDLRKEIDNYISRLKQ